MNLVQVFEDWGRLVLVGVAVIAALVVLGVYVAPWKERLSELEGKGDTGQYTPREGEQRDERFVATLEELTAIKNQYVVKDLDWYKGHARWPWLLFRGSGLFLILFSVSVPFLATREGFWKETVLPAVALVIAGLTGLNAFFQWQEQWRGFRQAQFTLEEHLLSLWEVKIVKAKQETQVEEAIKIALQATEELVEKARQAIAAETGQYFERVQPVQTTPASAPAPGGGKPQG